LQYCTQFGASYAKIYVSMQIVPTVAAFRRYMEETGFPNATLGFVPTMGALHEGHLALIRASKEENDLTACSIFVNPIQFNNPEDLAKYPRTIESDCAKLERAGCDVVFVPPVEEMYPDGGRPVLGLQFGALEAVMEGAFRPGHFSGVGIVVSKLFHMARPDRAYFGQKDLQQTAVVKCLVRDLSFPVEIRICPTLREPDGLAMSSRNVRLSEAARAIAPHLFRILDAARKELISGVAIEEVKRRAAASFGEWPAFRLEYFEIVDATYLQPLEAPEAAGNNAICVAAYLDGVRLIDNVVF